MTTLQAPNTLDLVLPAPRPTNKSGKPSWREYNIILFPRSTREFFPGYEDPFVMETDIGEAETWVTSARGGQQPSRGDPNAGGYVCTPRKGRRTYPNLLSLSTWYSKHEELEPGDVLRVAVQSPIRFGLSTIKYETYIQEMFGKWQAYLARLDQSMRDLRGLPLVEEALHSLESTRQSYLGEVSKMGYLLKELRKGKHPESVEGFLYYRAGDGSIHFKLTPEEIRQINEDFLDAIGR